MCEQVVCGQVVCVCEQVVCGQVVCVRKLCVSKLCVDKLCLSKLCVSKLCVDKLCVSKLCVCELCVSKLCVDKLCVSKRRRREEADGGIQNQKQEPHTKMWGKMFQTTNQIFWIYKDVCGILWCDLRVCLTAEMSDNPNYGHWPSQRLRVVWCPCHATKSPRWAPRNLQNGFPWERSTHAESRNVAECDLLTNPTVFASCGHSALHHQASHLKGVPGVTLQPIGSYLRGDPTHHLGWLCPTLNIHGPHLKLGNPSQKNKLLGIILSKKGWKSK